MSNNRGIFESFPNQPATAPDSPFAIVKEPAAAASPFAAMARQDSPFTVIGDANESRPVEPGRPARVPERRKIESPFQVAEPPEEFGFEAPAKPALPFDTPAPTPATVSSPFSLAPQQASSPFAVAENRGPSPSTQAAIAAFQSWPEPAPAAAPVAAAIPSIFAQQTPAAAPAPVAPAPVQVPSAFAQTPPLASPLADEFTSDSFSIKQLELRAIFGVDREMNPDEILQRSRALPGVRNVARVSPQDMAGLETLRNLLPNLGFGSGGLKLYAGSVPLDFIREGSIMLAVQTDGGFAPGVRETLMLVARELGRLS